MGFPRTYAMLYGVLTLGLLVLSQSYNRRIIGLFTDCASYGWVQDALGNNSLVSMAVRYTGCNLLNLKRNYYLPNDIYELCRNVGVLRPPRYTLCASKRRFSPSSVDNICVPAYQRSVFRMVSAGADLNNLSALPRIELSSLASTLTDFSSDNSGVSSSQRNVQRALCADKLPRPQRTEKSSQFSTIPRVVKSALFNARSVNNKSLILSDIIIEKGLDLVCLTETWHNQSDGLLFNDLTPTGYGLFDSPRSSGRGGGIIVLFKQDITFRPVVIPHFKSFECLALSISAPSSIVIATVYRPPKPNAAFLSEFADLLSMLCLKFEETLILGDFNIHVDKKDSAMTKDFLSLLECFDLKQLVDFSTHNKGHTLDLVISSGSFLSQPYTLDLGLSDHFAVLFNMELENPNISTSRTIIYRNWKSIDLQDFSAFIESSLMCFSFTDPLEDKVSLLNSVILSGLDSFAPMKSRSVSYVRSAPWYNNELRTKKAMCRKMERRWRLSGMNVHHHAWKDNINEYKADIASARSQYFSQIIINNQSKPRQLFHVINKLLKGDSSSHTPIAADLCDRFLDFFSSKIEKACSSLSCTAVIDDSAFCTLHFSGSPLSNFSILDLTSLGKVVSQMKVTTSIADPLPTCLFKACFSCLCGAEHC